LRKYLLDSGVASDYVNRRLGAEIRVRQLTARGDRVGVCMPVLAELFAGIELSISREKNHARLVHVLPTLKIWPFDRAAAQEYGRIYAFLRRTGRPMQQIDMQIAAIALTLGSCSVVSKDADFSAVPGLTVENWSQAG